MWLPDPFQAAQPPQMQDLPEEELEEPRDYHEFFWDDVQLGSRYAGNESGMHVDVCRFDEYGQHVTMAKNCPHYDPEDEVGKKISPGWTVQQNRVT